MKRILFAFAAAIFLTACSSDSPIDPNKTEPPVTPTKPGEKPPKPIPDSEWNGDWNNPNDPAYQAQHKGIYVPMEGYWIVTEVDGKPYNKFEAHQFTLHPLWGVCLIKPDKGQYVHYEDYGRLAINNTAFKSTKGVIYKYSVTGSGDNKVLTIFDGTTTKRLKPYDNNGVWVWEGDWNNPGNPHYKRYEGKYNPLGGTTWMIIKVGDDPDLSKDLLIFYKDFTLTWYSAPENRRSYEINDTGVREAAYSSHPSYTRSYKISSNKDTLYYRTMEPAPPGEGMTLIRYNKIMK